MKLWIQWNIPNDAETLIRYDNILKFDNMSEKEQNCKFLKKNIINKNKNRYSPGYWYYLFSLNRTNYLANFSVIMTECCSDILSLGWMEEIPFTDLVFTTTVIYRWKGKDRGLI